MIKPNILLQNPDFMVIDKPAGWYSIPAREPKPSDLVVTEWARAEANVEPWVIHRLDRFTSGVMALALNKSAHVEGNRWFEERLVKKIYLFLAAAGAGSALPSRPAIQIKTPVDGKPAQTLFELLSVADPVFLGRATPLTGRFHQIREHARDGKFPLLGDSTYGFNAAQTGIDFPRVALHAYELHLPFGTVRAPLPQDFTDVIHKLGLTFKS